MVKPRDSFGNDFIAPCAYLAALLFRDKYKREGDPKCRDDSAKIRGLSEDLYSVVIRHWKEWGDD